MQSLRNPKIFPTMAMAMSTLCSFSSSFLVSLGHILFPVFLSILCFYELCKLWGGATSISDGIFCMMLVYTQLFT